MKYSNPYYNYMKYKHTMISRMIIKYMKYFLPLFRVRRFFVLIFISIDYIIRLLYKLFTFVIRESDFSLTLLIRASFSKVASS